MAGTSCQRRRGGTGRPQPGPAPLPRQVERGNDCGDHRRPSTVELGAPEIAREAERRGAGNLWPAESTIGEVLKRAGLTHRRRPRVRTPAYGQPFAAVDE